MKDVSNPHGKKENEISFTTRRMHKDKVNISYIAAVPYVIWLMIFCRQSVITLITKDLKSVYKKISERTS